MDVDDKAEIRHLHLGEGFVAQDPRVVDEDVDPAPFFHRGLDHRCDVRVLRHVRAVGDRFAAAFQDFLDDRFGRRERRSRAVARAAEIVDDDLRPARREREGMRAAKAVAGAGDDGDLAVEPDGQGSAPYFE